jgi:hypothetical protein
MGWSLFSFFFASAMDMSPRPAQSEQLPLLDILIGSEMAM